MFYRTLETCPPGSLVEIVTDPGTGRSQRSFVTVEALQETTSDSVAVGVGGQFMLDTAGQVLWRSANGFISLAVENDGLFLQHTSDVTKAFLDIKTSLKIDGTKVIGAQGAAVADASDEADAVTKLNALLARLRAHGLIAT